ncbi:MAG: FHA domain-containing protein, partial [Pseudomonadota bacterium]
MVALRLELDNMTNLPDGGPTFLEVQGRRSVDIGRNTYLDWSLPDPSRVVSGKHCEIHYRDGGYWLTDVSTNGTYLNGSDSRLTEPTRLQTGDRLAIGDYLINVTVEDGDGDSAPAAIPHTQLPEAPAADAGSLWDVPDDAIAPAEPRERRRTAESTPVQADVLDWIADIPQVDHTAKTPLDPAPELTEAPANPVPPEEAAPSAPPADALPQSAFDPPTEEAPAPIAPPPAAEDPAPIVTGPIDAEPAGEPQAAPILPSDPDPTPALAELGATAFDPPSPAPQAADAPLPPEPTTE